MSKQLSVRVSDELYEALEEFRKGQPYKPDKSDIVRTALTEHIERESDIDIPSENDM